MYWLKKNLVSNLTSDKRRALVERDAEVEIEIEAEPALPLTLQAELLSVSRANLYYHPRPARTQEITVKHLGENFVLPVLDVLYTEHPFLGSRKIVLMLAAKGFTFHGRQAYDSPLSPGNGSRNAVSQAEIVDSWHGS